MISVIIPAHDEERTIQRCLRALTADVPEGGLEILVVCNGCTDRTAELARGFHPAVRVVELRSASKTAALNEGDRTARGFPRFFVDADVVLGSGDVRRMAAALARGPALAAAPTMELDWGAASWAVRAYYRVWRELPYTRDGFMGVGVYALSETGRQRFERFPEIIADDGYVRMLFAPEERVRVPDAFSVVRAPANLRALVGIKTRSRLGLYELRREFPDLVAREQRTKRYGAALTFLLRRPDLWTSAIPYLFVNLAARYRARRQGRLGQHVWERDETTRAGSSQDEGRRGALGGELVPPDARRTRGAV